MESLALAFVADRCEPFYHGGYERHTWEVARRLAKRHQVWIFTSLSKKSAEVEGVRFVRIAPPLPYVRHRGGHSLGQAMLFASGSFPMLPRKGRFDFVDVLGIPYGQMPFVRLRQVFADWKWGVTVWEAWYNYAYLSGFLAGTSRVAFRTLLHLALVGDHKVIVGSHHTKKALETRYMVRGDRIAVVPPGIDLAAIDRTPAAPLKSDIIYVGRLDHYKRVCDLLDAAALLKRGGLDVTISLIGDGPERASLEKQASNLGIREQVVFHGFATEEAKHALLKASKCFVLTSEREGFSIATLEAMACGLCPVVARPSDDEGFGVADLAKEEETALTFRTRSPEDLAQTLKRVLEERSLRERLARNAATLAGQYDIVRTPDLYLSAVIN